jgi:hypothetical protein
LKPLDNQNTKNKNRVFFHYDEVGQYKNKSGELGIAIENLCLLSIIVFILKKEGKGCKR